MKKQISALLLICFCASLPLSAARRRDKGNDSEAAPAPQPAQTESKPAPSPSTESFVSVEEEEPEEIKTDIKLPNFVTVRGGQFTMGSSKGEPAETPVHKVNVSTFEITKTEITQYFYEQVMGENPSRNLGEDKPVENMSWFDAVLFCNKLSIAFGYTPCYSVNNSTDPEEWGYTPHIGRGMPGAVMCDFTANGFRLPTEAEWEYAAVDGSKNVGFAYAGSSNPNQVAWHSQNSGNHTHDVASKNPTGLGLYDMSGNVFEWVWDYYDEKFYATSGSWDPIGPTSGGLRVVRGGCYDMEIDVCRVASRLYANPANRGGFLGFRIVRRP